MKKTIKKLRKRGVSNLDILKAKEIARRETDKMRAECFEQALLFTLGISVNILTSPGYWYKTGKKKIPIFVNDFLSLLKSAEAGVVTEEDMLNEIKEYAGVDLKTYWYAAKSKYEDRHS